MRLAREVVEGQRPQPLGERRRRAEPAFCGLAEEVSHGQKYALECELSAVEEKP